MRALKVIGKIFLVIAIAILCVSLFASTLVTMLVADVRVATNKDNLQKLISQTLSVPAQQQSLQSIALAAGTGADAKSGSADFTDVLVQFAFDSLKDMAGDGEMPFTLEDVKGFVEDSTFKDFLADKASGIVSDIYTGNNTTSITSKELVDLLTENKAALKEHFNLELDDEIIQQLEFAIDEIPAMQQIQQEGIASIITGSSTTDTESDNTTDLQDSWYGKLPGFSAYVEAGGASNIMNNPIAMNLALIRFYTSATVLWLCIGVCAVLMGLLFLCAWKKPANAMLESGITIFLAGAIFLIPTMVAWLAPATWMELFSFEPMIGTAGRFVLLLTSSVCGTVAGIGIALIAGSIVVKVLLRKKAAAMSAAAEETPAEETPAEEAPAEEAPTEETPAEETV